MMEIEFNYGRAINQANQVDAVANEMLSVANKQIQTTLDSIAVCWRGDASRHFLTHCTTTQKDILAQAKRLQDLAKRIREVAKILKEAEEAAKAAATKASGGDGGKSLQI